jgi:hypothetical protein
LKLQSEQKPIRKTIKIWGNKKWISNN